MRDSHEARTSGVVALLEADADHALARSVVDALRREHLAPEGRLTVAVAEGWLTLGGHVEHVVELAAAECVGRYVPGVTGVTNRIAVLKRAD